MADGWRILDLTEAHGRIDVERGAIVVQTKDGEHDPVVAADIALVLLGTGITFSSGVLHRLAEHDVVMMMCDWRGVPRAAMLPWAERSRISARQIAQAGLSVERKAEAWRELVQAKLHGQAATLRSEKPRLAPALDEWAEKVAPGDPDNLEAQGARHYFKGLWGPNFVRDHDGGDRINALLNYGYGILRGHGVRAVLSAGLVPSLGVSHAHRSNPFNLVADLMEPFRPAVDSAIVDLPPYSSLKKPETKKLLATAFEAPLGAGGLTVASELAALAKRYGRFAEGERDTLDVLSWQGSKKP
jgi:CRISPR-associated protein Cas1